MMQGDASSLGFTVRNNAGQSVTPEDILDMELTLGPLVKTLSRGQLLYLEGRWLFPLSQQESFSLWPGSVKAQIRILWKNGVVEGKPIHGILLGESISKEVL